MRKAYLPICEQLSLAEFEDYLEEELVKFKRTQISTNVLVEALTRALRPVVMRAAEYNKQVHAFEDLLHDTILYMLEWGIFKFDPFRGRAVYWTQFTGWFYSLAQCCRVYKSDHLLDDKLLYNKSEPQQNTFFLEDFLAFHVRNLHWRHSPKVCNWVACFILAGVRRRWILRVLHQTLYPKKEQQAEAIKIFQYVTVTLRLEVMNALDRYS